MASLCSFYSDFAFFVCFKMTLQQVCADVNRIKNLGQQMYIASRSKPQNANEQAVSSEVLGGKLIVVMILKVT